MDRDSLEFVNSLRSPQSSWCFTYQSSVSPMQVPLPPTIPRSRCLPTIAHPPDIGISVKNWVASPPTFATPPVTNFDCSTTFSPPLVHPPPPLRRFQSLSEGDALVPSNPSPVLASRGYLLRHRLCRRCASWKGPSALVFKQNFQIWSRWPRYSLQQTSEAAGSLCDWTQQRYLPNQVCISNPG